MNTEYTMSTPTCKKYLSIPRPNTNSVRQHALGSESTSFPVHGTTVSRGPTAIYCLTWYTLLLETGQVAFRGAKRASKGSSDLLRRDSRETGKKNKTPPPRRLGSSSPAQTRGNASATNRHRRCKAVRLTTTKFNPECNAGTIHKKNTNAAAAAAR